MEDGHLQAKDVNEIMFRCRSTRCGIKNLNSRQQTQRGYMCHYQIESNGACGHIVADLKRHLVTIHNLNRGCSLFEDLVEKGLHEKPGKRKLDRSGLVNIDNDDEQNTLLVNDSLPLTRLAIQWPIFDWSPNPPILLLLSQLRH